MGNQVQNVEITIEVADPRSPEVSAIISRSRVLMQASISPGEGHFFSADELCAPEITLFAARAGSKVVGIGALANRGDYGEVKSLFTDHSTRGQGIADALLTQIETAAHAANLPALRLETGDLLHEAHRLFVRHDFTYCEAFGGYLDDGASIFMEKVF